MLEHLRVLLPPGYTLEEQLGKGGQGAVFKGTRNGRDVALKFFGPTDPERLRREIELLQKVSCPNLVGLEDFHLLRVPPTLGTGVLPMAVYELIDGGDLRGIVGDSSRMLSESELIALGRHVGGAIDTLWANRIVHRDIKPENIMLAAGGRFVLVDVGLAQHLELSTITAALGNPGTNGYRSPEQCGGRRRLTIHSDVFSLGVTMFEVASRQHPWGRNQAAMLSTPPTPLQTLRPDLPPKLTKLIHQMLERIPAQRPRAVATRFDAIEGV